MKKRLAIVTTHPIQYYAPLFRQIHASGLVDLMVFYTWGDSSIRKFDPGFGKTIEWDLPILDGYPWQWVENTAADPGTHHFRGIRNPALPDQLREFKPDVILVYGWSWMSHLKLLIRKPVPCTVWFRGDSHTLDPISPVKRLLRNAFLRVIYHRVDRFLTVGSANERYYQDAGIPDSRMVRIPHSIDQDRFAEPDAVYLDQAHQYRDRLGIKPGDFVFLFAGKFEAKKGIQTLIEAFRNLNLSNATLLVAGDGPLKNEIADMAAQSKRILLLPFHNQSDMPVLYRTADCFVYPSHGPGETWGLAVNEALACRRPVIVSDRVGCAADLIQTGKNGWVFTNRSVPDLTRCMMNAVESDLKQTLSADGIHQTDNPFTYAYFTRTLARLVTEP